MASFTERAHIDDTIRYELYDGYTRKAVVVHNRTGSTVTSADVIGMPLQKDSSVATDAMFLQAGAESYCIGLCLHAGSFAVNTLANLGTFKTKMLVRGPAIVDQSWIKAADVLGASYTMATIVTALAGLNPPIIVNTELTPTVTQTT